MQNGDEQRSVQDVFDAWLENPGSDNLHTLNHDSYALKLLTARKWKASDIAEWLVKDVRLPEYAPNAIGSKVDSKVRMGMTPHITSFQTEAILVDFASAVHKRRGGLQAAGCQQQVTPDQAHVARRRSGALWRQGSLHVCFILYIASNDSSFSCSPAWLFIAVCLLTLALAAVIAFFVQQASFVFDMSSIHRQGRFAGQANQC